MAKASLIGLITQGPELQHSAKGEPYVRFSAAEYVGFGSQRHTQFVGVGRVHQKRRHHKG